jgi:hypothetical protein
MRPGEYCNAPQAHPFRLQDVKFAQGTRCLNVDTCTDQALLQASCVVITYNDQKNANRGEKIRQGRSGDPYFCPVLALARRIIHLQTNRAPRDSPIYAYYPQFRSNVLRATSSTITEILRTSARLLDLPDHEVTGIHARTLHASGASALLHAQIDSDLIHLLGRWQSDSMLRYLHTQSAGVVRNLAGLMLTHGAAYNPLT